MFKHQVSNQFNWLLLYIKQPVKSKIRKLFLNQNEVLDFLYSQNFELVDYVQENNSYVYTLKRNKQNIILKKDLLIIDGMNVILTKDFFKTK